MLRHASTAAFIAERQRQEGGEGRSASRKKKERCPGFSSLPRRARYCLLLWGGRKKEGQTPALPTEERGGSLFGQDELVSRRS